MPRIVVTDAAIVQLHDGVVRKLARPVECDRYREAERQHGRGRGARHIHVISKPSPRHPASLGRNLHVRQWIFARNNTLSSPRSSLAAPQLRRTVALARRSLGEGGKRGPNAGNRSKQCALTALCDVSAPARFQVPTFAGMTIFLFGGEVPARGEQWNARLRGWIWTPTVVREG